MKLTVPPLDMEYDKDFFLFLSGKKLQPDIRLLCQMAEVIYDKNFLGIASPEMKLYYMYRGVCRKEDAALFSENNIRYDVTIIPALLLGMEPNKTAGHYHPKANGLEYSEIYEVVAGEAHYLLQKSEDAISDFVLVKAKAGDIVIIPPGYGHVTVNPGPKTLVMANLMRMSVSSMYEPIKKKKGCAYFELQDGRLIKNECYESPPEPRILSARKIKGINENIYKAFIESPNFFEFLKKPELTDDSSVRPQ
ncbi:MAG: glucose-6-phosphate isomerase [Candidatus Aenigmarchaeota archaeon]|nr:glucose-6-phosphate isomerase [Candidatus Aenigmarchaeota archaeon]